jgi:hypothetical protein
LEKIAADPTKFYTGRGIASLKELRSQLTKGADVRAKSYRINGYTPIAGGGVQSSVGIGQDRVFPNEADATSAAQPGQSVRFYRVNPQTGIPEIVTGTME